MLKMQTKLAANAASNLRRKRITINKRQDNNIIADDQSLINFSHNDYLSIATDPRVRQAFIEGVDKYGFGSGSAPVVSGYYAPHQEFEQQFAEFIGFDRAIVFNSGYHANLGVITTFAKRDSMIVADKLCHASMIDGAILARAKLLRYIHNNTMQAEDLLLRAASKSKLLLTESVYSMEGDIANINALAKLAKRYDSGLIIDDGHGIGWLGEQGKGVCDYAQLNQNDLTCVTMPLGKAFGGVGGIVVGSNETIEALLQFARSYRYSTALPPAIVHAAITALKVIRAENWRREKLKSLIQFFITQAKERNLNLSSAALTPIKCIIVGDNQAAVTLQQKLMQQGFLVAAIRPPTVPKGSARIRISLNCLHTEAQVASLLSVIARSVATK